MKYYYMEYRYDGMPDSEPTVYTELSHLIQDLIEWYQIIKYMIRQYNSSSFIEEKIRPNQLVYLLPINKQIVVYRLHSKILPEDIVVYCSERTDNGQS
jgi:hypothetical protein